MLLGFLGLGGQYGEYYLKNGGDSFFKSYGIEATGSLTSIREQIPESHLSFIKNLELGVSLGEFIFVHAGVSPRRALDQQIQEDLLWIREDFIQHPHPFGKIVVFGHTAFNQVFLDLPYRIGIDTGVAYGNRLSAVELVHGELYQVEVGGRAISQSQLEHLLPATS
jgi:serine/threonine protein phosphatase 1